MHGHFTSRPKKNCMVCVVFLDLVQHLAQLMHDPHKNGLIGLSLKSGHTCTIVKGLVYGDPLESFV